MNDIVYIIRSMWNRLLENLPTRNNCSIIIAVFTSHKIPHSAHVFRMWSINLNYVNVSYIKSNLVDSDLGYLISGAESFGTGLNNRRSLDSACCNIGLCVRILLPVFWHFWIIVSSVQCMVKWNFDSKLWPQFSKTNVTKVLGCIILGTNVTF